MRQLTDTQFDILKSICQLDEQSLLKAIFTTLQESGYKKIDYTKSWVYAQGTFPIMVVAHVDTVFKNLPQEIFYDREAGAIWSPYGLGADDRAGVFAIVNLLFRGLYPSILLLTGEEKGCVGAQEFIKKYPKTPRNIKYIIELDRAGTEDCVFYLCGNKDFVSFIESFGFKEQYGTYSDIIVLGPQWDIATVNLSIGYEREHTIGETLYIEPMLNTIEKVMVMLKESSSLQTPFFKYCYKEEPIPTTYDYCDICLEPIDEVETFKVLDTDLHRISVCPTCLAKINVKWCENCFRPFIYTKETKDNKLCPICQQKEMEVVDG